MILALAGCGYGFRGTVSNLPPEIKTVAIPFLVNQTGETGLEEILTQALIREFNRSKLLKLTDIQQADSILKGQITGVSSGAVAFEDTRTALERRVLLRTSLELIRTDNRQVLWRNRGLSEGEDYDVDADPAVTEENRQKALTKAAKNLAVKAHDAIFENF